jgi:hypothetical protein
VYLGDSQMFALDYKLREAVWAWAETANIRIEYAGTDFNQDVWRVVNTGDCLMFTLRWK